MKEIIIHTYACTYVYRIQDMKIYATGTCGTLKRNNSDNDGEKLRLY